MPRVAQHPKAETFNFRIDPDLKAAFTAAAEAEDRPAAQVLRDFMRAYVKRNAQRTFLDEAHRQSLAIAERSRDPRTDDYASLQELDALFDADLFRDEPKR
jgi:predicted transcriptional regulator